MSEQRLVAVFCLGQGSSRASFMMIAAEAGVPLSLLERGQLDRGRHWPAVADAVELHHQRRMALLDLEDPTPEHLHAALDVLRCEHGELALVVIDALESVAPGQSDRSAALVELASDLAAPVLAGVNPSTAGAARAAGLATTVIHLPDVGDEVLFELGPRTLPVRVDADRIGGSTTFRLEYDPHCCAWDVSHARVLGSLSSGGADSPSGLSRREGKELDAVYSAACCALLLEVGLHHYWDGHPHGPGRAWDLPHDDRLSDDQRLVARLALDIWDNQGGLLLRDLRQLSASMVADVGELIADTSSVRGPLGWVERHLGQAWQHWMDEGRWEQLLGAGWRELLGRDAE